MKRGKVVVAQRQPKTLEVIRVHLEQIGYDAVPTLDGVQAYEAIEKGEPVAVILDLDLPGMSGFRLVKLIRHNPRWRDLPLIVASAYAFEEVEDIVSERIDAFVRKPLDPKDLLSKLELALRRAQRVAA